MKNDFPIIKPNDPSRFLSQRDDNAPYPRSVSKPGEGGKFDTEGTVLRWPGNTIVCHINPQSAAYMELVLLQNKIRESAFSDFFTYLPPSSFHMTLFEGFAPFLPEDGIWPAGLSKEKTLEQSTNELHHALEGSELSAHFKIQPIGLNALHSVTVAGANRKYEALLRDTRTKLRELTGIHPDNFSQYAFHITLAYPVKWASEVQASEMHALGETFMSSFMKTSSSITLGPAQLCTFQNMHHFEPVIQLGD